jgi:hypothetical protein
LNGDPALVGTRFAASIVPQTNATDRNGVPKRDRNGQPYVEATYSPL